jgi:hypothetical protein
MAWAATDTVLRLGGAVQQYAWGKVGEDSKVRGLCVGAGTFRRGPTLTRARGERVCRSRSTHEGCPDSSSSPARRMPKYVLVCACVRVRACVCARLCPSLSLSLYVSMTM